MFDPNCMFDIRFLHREPPDWILSRCIFLHCWTRTPEWWYKHRTLLPSTAYGSSYLKFDERTVSPHLSLSDDFCTLTFLHKKARQPLHYDPARFDYWSNALGSVSMSSGTHSWVVDVGQSAAFKVGVCYASLERKGSGNEARLGYNSQSWVLSHFDGAYSFCHRGKEVPLQVVRRPQRIGLLLDWPSQTLVFYETESSAVLYSVTHQFSAPLLPACAVTDRSVTILHWPETPNTLNMSNCQKGAAHLTQI